MSRKIAFAAGLLLIASRTWFMQSQAFAQLLPPILPPPGGSLIVTVTSPSSGSTVSGTVPVSASVGIIGSLTIASVQFKLDGANLGAEDTSSPYSVSWNTIATSNGSHTLTAVARDLLGLTFNSGPVTVSVSNDTTPPTVAITSPASGSTIGGTITVSANASDNRGVAGVQFTLDGANLGAEDGTAPYSVSWNTTTAANGTHTLRAIARDAASNRTTSSTVTVTVFNDAIAPSVSITSPARGATVSGTISVTANASDNIGVAGVQFKLDGANLGAEDTSAPYSVSWNTTTASNGSHALMAVARDAKGNQTPSSAITVTVSNGPPPDTVPPSAAISAPANGATVSGTISVTASASDNVGVAAVQFFLDGVLAAEDATAAYSVSWDTTTAANGSHSLSATARDAAGNTRTSVPVTVIVSNGSPPDKTPPSVAISAPANGGTVSGTISVTANASDNRSVVGVQFRLDGANLGAEDTSVPYSVSWNTTAAGNGSHTLTAIARDASGNRTTSTGVTVNVSNGSTALSRFEEDNAAVNASPAAWVRRGPEIAAFSGGTAGSSNVAGATVTFTFTGTAVNWIGLKCSVCGVATVSIDGGAATSVNTAGTAAPGSAGLASEAVFSASGLTPGTHTLVITVTGDTTSGDAHIIVDGFDAAGSPAGTGTTRIEDTDPAVRYTGDWIHLTDPRASAGTAAEAQTAGAVATLSFTGTGVSWFGYRYEGGGIARVLVDGVFVGEVDTYSPSPELAAVFSASGRVRGAHTLTIEVTGTRNPASNGAWVIVDSFEVIP